MIGASGLSGGAMLAGAKIATLTIAATGRAGTDDPIAANEAMLSNPYFAYFATRRENGRLPYDMTLSGMKRPGESLGGWDGYTSRRAGVPADKPCLTVT